MTQSARHTTPSASERGATRRGSSGLTPNEALVVVLLQQGKTVAAVAQEIGVSDRQVRRLRASAVRHGALLDPPRASAPQGDDGRFTAKPEKPPARVPVIGLTGGGGHPAMLIRPGVEEDPERRRARTGGDGRMSLGVEAAIGDVVDPMGDGRRLVKIGGALIQDTGPRLDAVSGYYADLDLRREIEQARAEGYETVHLTYPDGSIREVDLTEDVA
jgi:hypothetical protein